MQFSLFNKTRNAQQNIFNFIELLLLNLLLIFQRQAHQNFLRSVDEIEQISNGAFNLNARCSKALLYVEYLCVSRFYHARVIKNLILNRVEISKIAKFKTYPIFWNCVIIMSDLLANFCTTNSV